MNLRKDHYREAFAVCISAEEHSNLVFPLGRLGAFTGAVSSCYGGEYAVGLPACTWPALRRDSAMSGTQSPPLLSGGSWLWVRRHFLECVSPRKPLAPAALGFDLPHL